MVFFTTERVGEPLHFHNEKSWYTIRLVICRLKREREREELLYGEIRATFPIFSAQQSYYILRISKHTTKFSKKMEDCIISHMFSIPLADSPTAYIYRYKKSRASITKFVSAVNGL